MSNPVNFVGQVNLDQHPVDPGVREDDSADDLGNLFIRQKEPAFPDLTPEEKAIPNEIRREYAGDVDVCTPI